MKLIEPNLATHQAARDILLTPNGLDEGHLLKVLGSIFTHRVDYADLYFQFTRSESWSLEESIVKTGSFSIDQGVGIRAVSGDRTAFPTQTKFLKQRYLMLQLRPEPLRVKVPEKLKSPRV